MKPTQPDGFLVPAKSGESGAVVVLHAWWGLNDDVRALCRNLASAGFTAFAPDLYHGKVADTIPGAEALATALRPEAERALAQVGEAAGFLAERTQANGAGLAVIGFSLGASYALDLAAMHPDHIRSVVIYYGNGGGDWSASRAAYLGHFGGQDDFEPRAGVDELEAMLRSARRPVTFHHYPGVGHWFAEPGRPDAYDKAAASLAWDRTLAFLTDPGAA